MLEVLGGLGLLVANLARTLVRRGFDRPEFFRSMVAYGEASLPIIFLASLFTGVIMVLLAAIYVAQFGVYHLVGWYAGFSTVREVGPVMIGLLFSGRVGASHTSEMAAMAVTEQMLMLRVLALDVFELFLLPRVLAMTLSLVALVIIGDGIAVAAGALAAKLLLGVDPHIFFSSLTTNLKPWDIEIGLIKAAGYGLMIGLTSSYFGIKAEGGAKAVGQAVNRQVVVSAIAIFVVDFGITHSLDV